MSRRHYFFAGVLVSIVLLTLLGSFAPCSIATAWSNDPLQNTAICTASGHQFKPQIISDGSGGAIITWQDYRSGSNYDVYAQRVDSTGNVQWTTDGMAISTASHDQAHPHITSDGLKGAIITWWDDRNGSNYDIYAQRVNSTGNVQWTTDGVPICTASGDQFQSQIASDGSGGAIITWQDYRSSDNYDIYAQRVDSSGNVKWTSDGVAICTASGTQSIPQIASDGSGGAIITWEDCRNSVYSDIYAQRLNSSGNALWTDNGIAICTAPNGQFSPQVISDGLGGAIFTWVDGRGGGGYFHIYAQRVDPSGNPQWTTDGLAICTASGDQESPQPLSDGSGGAMFTWQDERSGNWTWNVYAQRVDSTGNVQWTTDGIPICSAPSSSPQLSPQIISDGSKGAIIAWGDYRSTTNLDIYAQWVSSNGSLSSPTLTLTSTATSPTKTSPIPMTATFSENVAGFVVGDIAVGNGAASNFVAVSATVYTFDVTPSGQGAVTVNVAADVAQDAATNGNIAATQFSITYDNVAPTVTLYSTATSPTKTSLITVAAIFSEAVTGFAVGDITVGNGTASELVAVNTSTYAFYVTAAGPGVVTVDVPADVAQDAAGNGNIAATQYSITYDRSPNQPTNTSPANGATLTTMTTTLQSSAFSDPDTEDTQAASQWQVRELSGSYSSPTYDSGTDNADLTIIAIPSGLLSHSTTYCWHVRYQGSTGLWSDWSTETFFTTTAKNGLPFWVWIVVGIAAVLIVGIVAYLVGRRRPAKP